MFLRRSHIVILGLLALAFGFGQALQSGLGTDEEIAFEPIDTLPDWRRVTFERVSGPGGTATGAIFVGLGEPDVVPVPADALCEELYPGTADGRRIAVFTDAQCPNCRSLESKLFTRDDLSITWIDLPLLGPASETAARVAIATEELGAEHLPPQTPRGSGRDALVRTYADQAGLDPEELAAAVDDPAVTARLDRNRRLAATLGVFGTPGMTIGKTLVIGDLRPDTLDRLLAMDHPSCD